jgi:Kdo2-lipid IVA lauroyltransferase/acyltransferase
MLARFGLALMWTLRFLPLAALSRAGEGFGWVLSVLAVERARICRINLEKCFPELSRSERDALVRAHFLVLGRSLLERGILWWSRRSRVERLVRLAGVEHLEPLRTRPVILFAPHFVGMDAGWTRLTCAYDLTSVYARQKNAMLDGVLLRRRTRFGRQRVFSRQQGIRSALGALRKGMPMYYLPDHDFGRRDAIFVPFFGVPAATVPGLSRLARLAGALVVPCVTRMLPGGQGYEVRIHQAWDDFPTDDLQADTSRMNAFIEERVREMPEQYYWTHKRFKTRPAGETGWY